MANNPHANKIVSFGQVLIDLTADTVTADHLEVGYTAHDASGAVITGTSKQIVLPLTAYDYEKGYNNQGSWIYEDSTNNHSDVYEIEEGHLYVLELGSVVGTRFRASALDTNPVGSTGIITGVQVVQQNNPQPHARAIFTAPYDGWVIVTKDNASTTGLKSYLFDITTP